ncbi:MAG: MmcB family DNA repair protein, partial [Pseudomonadota bacterium]
MSITASDINRALKERYSGQEWRIWFEVSQSTGAISGRRADAVAMNIWPSKGFQIHVFEVKVSRSDFKAELADPNKWKAIGKHADFFWLACPVGLVDREEVPEAWGLMELTKGG